MNAGPGHSSGSVTISPLVGIPEVAAGDDLAAVLLTAAARSGLPLTDGDIVVVSSKIASKALGLTASPEDKAGVVATQTVTVVAERAVGAEGRVTQVVRSVAGPVLAAAGVDASNTGGRDVLLLLPADPDAVCRALRERLQAASGVRRVGVLLTDTAGRPWRVGQTDFALGAAGLQVLDDLRGSVDADGRPLEVTSRAVADELAAAADLVKGKTTRIPAVLVRGLAHLVLHDADAVGSDHGCDQVGARHLVRSGDGDWFALGDQEAVRAALGAPPGTGLAEQARRRPVAGDTVEARIDRALRVAFVPQLDPHQSRVTITGPARADGAIDIDGDTFGVGLVTARALVALAGEGVPHRLVAVADGSARLEPLPPAPAVDRAHP